jgi:hypothetical protein
MQRFIPPLLLSVLLSLLPFSQSIAAECDISSAKIALHVADPTSKIPCGLTAIPCSQASSGIVTTGDLNREYRVYVLLTNWSSDSGILQAQIGADYDAAIGTGVDVLDFQPCGSMTTPIGNWPDPGSQLIMSYGSCQSPNQEDLLVLGWFTVIAHTPGSLSARPRALGMTGTVPRVVNCDLQEKLIHPQNVGEVAFGGTGHFDPCSEFIDTFSGACCWPDSCKEGTNLACCWADGGTYLGAFAICGTCLTKDLPKTWGQMKARYR